MSAVVLERTALALGIGGIVVSAIGWVLTPAVFAHAWLAALILWLAWPLGSLGLLLIHALTGGRWGFAIRRPLLAGTATLPLVVPALLPVILLAPALYPWLQPQIAATLPNHFYLNAPFACIRMGLYLLVWHLLALLVGRAVRQEHATRRLARLAPAALILLVLSITFAAIDLTLSLQPKFTSSVYGWMACSEALLLALSVALLLATRVEPPDRQDLARLLLALVVLFAYLDFMQLLIIWNSNLPKDALWYGPRLVGQWGGIAALVAIFHFGLPLFVLIFPPLQQSARAVTMVAASLVVTEILRAWWLVIPAEHRDLSWIDVGAMLALLSFAAALAIRALRQGNELWEPLHG